MSSSYANPYKAGETAHRYGTAVSVGDTYIDDFLRSQVIPMISAKRSIFLPAIDIGRIMFAVSEKEGEYVLSNSQWPSLTSSGVSLSDAIANMVELIHTVSSQYILESDENLSEDGIEFKKFLLGRIFR